MSAEQRNQSRLPLRDPQRAIIVPPGGNADHLGDGVYALLTEEGECIATHVCSHPIYAPGDLWERRAERREEFADRNITEVVWLADSGLTLDELKRRNELFALQREALGA